MLVALELIMSSDSVDLNRGYERPLNSERREIEDETNHVRPVWTTLMEEMLIYYIRANRLLWDTKHPLFTKPSLKRGKVEDIAAIINREAVISEENALSPEDVWRKFRNLRTFFVREVRKVNESKLESSDALYVSKWIHFNRMLFLVDSLKKSIEATGNFPGDGTNSASVKLEGGRGRVPVSSISTLDSLQQQHQEAEDELRIGGEWESEVLNESSSFNHSRPPVPGSSYNTTSDRNCDRVISRSRIVGSAAKRAKLTQIQEKKISEVTDAFGNFVTASVRRLPEDKQHALMAKITQAISEFHSKP